MGMAQKWLKNLNVWPKIHCNQSSYRVFRRNQIFGKLGVAGNIPNRKTVKKLKITDSYLVEIE